jgi:hypothetical protein
MQREIIILSIIFIHVAPTCFASGSVLYPQRIRGGGESKKTVKDGAWGWPPVSETYSSDSHAWQCGGKSQIAL